MGRPAFTASIDYFRNAGSGTPAPSLTVTKSHTGNFTKGGTGSYTITAGNIGTAPTTGVVTMTDTVPTGLTATARMPRRDRGRASFEARHSVSKTRVDALMARTSG